MKNFGLSKWNANAGGFEDEEEMTMNNSIGLFDGSVQDVKNENKQKFLEGL